MTILPKNGNVSLEALLEAIRSSSSELHIGPVALYSFVAFADPDGRLHPFAGKLEFGLREAPIVPRGGKNEPMIWPIGDLRLIHAWHHIDVFSSKAAFEAILGSWSPLLNAAALGTSVGAQASVWRDYTRQKGDHPRWRFDLFYEDQSLLYNPVPDGPFIDVHHDFQASSIADATAQWLRMPDAARNFSPRKSFAVTIPDHRAWIASVELRDSTLYVDLKKAALQQMYLTVIAENYRGFVQRGGHVAREGVIDLVVPIPLRSVQLFLTDDEGYCYDTFYDTPEVRSRGFRLFESNDSDPHREFVRALSEGESDRFEFKEWLPIDRRQNKSVELLKSTCAFANSRGGQIYVGVNDELEIVGCARGLNAMAAESKRSHDECRDVYAQSVRRIVSEGIAPALTVESRWITFAGLDILSIGVPATGAVHHVVESNTTYVRKGGNNKKATADELAHLALR